MTALLRALLMAVASACLVGASSERAGATQGQAPTFRARVTVVPLDVRVVDRHGRRVENLTQDDFLVFEDGVRQEITHFEPYVLKPGAARSLGDRSTTAPFALDVPVRRVIYLELNRLPLGRPRFGLLEALTTFLRQRLLPQDYAVVSSLGRMTDLTTDHEALAQVIERLSALQATIGEGPDRFERQLALYGWRRQPADSPVRQALDAAFAPASSGLRLSLKPEVEFAKMLNAMESNWVFAEEAPGRLSHLGHPSVMPMPPSEPNPGIAQSAQSIRSEMLTVLGALQYLRFLDGEKHLVYFPSSAPAAVEDDRQIIRIANEARVAIHSIRGTQGLAANGSVNLFADLSAKNIGAGTGGSAYLNRWPDEALAAIDDLSRGGYLVAYSPRKAIADERYRKITVRLKQPNGARVLVRDSYLSTDHPAEYEPSSYMAKQHMLTVAQFPGGVDDLGVTLTPGAPTQGTFTATLRVDVSRVEFTTEKDRHQAKLELAVFCNDSRDRFVGQHWMTLDLKLKDDTLTKALAQGLTQVVTVPVTGRVRFAKAVVLDYGSQRAGAVIAEVK